MTQSEFIKHACEQVLRFTRADKWDDLSEAVKVQLGFNMGAMALGLSLPKEDGFLALANAREGKTTMAAFRQHLQSVIKAHNIAVDPAQIARPF
jgi:hypothetical protein